MTLIESYAAVALQVVGTIGGVACGVIAVWLARTIPPRMELEERARPLWWWALAVVVGGVYGWLTANAVDSWELLPAYLTFIAATLGLSLIDLDHQLLPNRILFPATGVFAALLMIGGLVEAGFGDLLRAALAGITYFAFLLVVAILARGGFGMGDVKLAFLLGLAMGFRSWGSLVVGMILAILLGGIASGLLLVFGRKGRKAKFAYGPYLVLGSWIAVVWGQQMTDWYFGT
jgi:leader peptidase (prepilin peptidase)/N-methyltransferase